MSQSSPMSFEHDSVAVQPHLSSIARSQALSSRSLPTSSAGVQQPASTRRSQSLSRRSQSSTVDGHASSGFKRQNARWLPSSIAWNGNQNAVALGSAPELAQSRSIATVHS